MSILMPGKDVPRPTHLLDAGEQLIWWDRPNPKEYALKEASVFKALFCLLFTAIGVGVTWKEFHAGTVFWPAGLIFVAAGLWGLTEPVRRYRKAPFISYVLTDRRAVIAEGKSIKSASVSAIRMIELSCAPDGCGNVLFLDELVGGGEDGPRPIRDGFIGIAGAAAVEREMRRLQSAIAA